MHRPATTQPQSQKARLCRCSRWMGSEPTFSHAAQQPLSGELPVAVSPASATVATALPKNQQMDAPSEQLPEHNAEGPPEPATTTIAATPATSSSASVTAVPCGMGPVPPAPATIPHDVTQDAEANTAGLLLLCPPPGRPTTSSGSAMRPAHRGLRPQGRVCCRSPRRLSCCHQCRGCASHKAGGWVCVPVAC